MDRPTWRGEMQVTGLPFDPFAIDDALAISPHDVIDGGRRMTVRLVDFSGRQFGNGRKKTMRGADAAFGSRVVQHIQVSAGIADVHAIYRLEVRCNVFPGPVQQLRIDGVDVDQPLV